MLEIAKIVELAKEHATPMYLFDLKDCANRITLSMLMYLIN